MSEDQNKAMSPAGGAMGFRADKDMADGKFRGGKRRRKVSYLTLNKIEIVDYKDISILRRFINDRGKILPSRQTGNSAKQQRMISRAIRRARELALLPFVNREMSSDRREFTPRRDRPPRDYNAPAPAATAPTPAPVAEETSTAEAGE